MSRAGSVASTRARSTIARSRGGNGTVHGLVATWSAISGSFARMRRIAPCATTQYAQWLAPEVATTTSSRSALLSPPSRSMSASW